MGECVFIDIRGRWILAGVPLTVSKPDGENHCYIHFFLYDFNTSYPQIAWHRQTLALPVYRDRVGKKDAKGVSGTVAMCVLQAEWHKLSFPSFESKTQFLSKTLCCH